MSLTVKKIDSLVREMYELPHRCFGLDESKYGTNEWRIRRMVANIIVGGSRDVQAVRATEKLFTMYTMAELGNVDNFTDQRRKIADMLEDDYKIKYAGKKAEYIQNAIRHVQDEFGGELPSWSDALKTIPGVGAHATAIIQALAFGLDSFGVDLHVRRIAKRMGLVDEKATDRTIEKLFLAESVNPGHLSRALVEFGQKHCHFRASCKACPVRKQCPQLK